VRRRRTVCGGALTLAALVALAGCGGGSGPKPAAGKGSGSGSGAPPVTVVQSPATGQFNASAIYQRDAPGVVTVISTFAAGAPSLSLPGAAAQGSGFVISAAGEVVTNTHVVTTGSASNLRRARNVYVQFADGNEVPARIVGTDPNADVALLRVDSTGLKLKPLALGSSSSLAVGAPVAALGTPFGEQGSLSVGVISATNRAIPSLNGGGGSSGFSTLGAIQTDAAINHGNSGGPLVDASGAVIGINSQIPPGSSGGASGVGFAVPVDAVKRSIAQLRAHGSVAYAYLGVSSEDLFPQLARRLGLTVAQGSIVDSVAVGSPAARAGLRGGPKRIQFDAQQYPIGGDVITKLNGHQLTHQFNLADAVTALSPGQRVTLEVWRGKTRREVRLTLGTRPS
jgi:S1-C subfamily serine protease